MFFDTESGSYTNFSFANLLHVKLFQWRMVEELYVQPGSLAFLLASLVQWPAGTFMHETK